MLYFERLPVFPLNEFIEKVWYCRAQELNQSSISLPAANHELILNLGDSYTIATQSGDALVNSSWVNGLQAKSWKTKSHGVHEMMGILFKPHGLSAFVSFPVSELSHQFVALDLVFGKEQNELRDEIDSKQEPEVKLGILEAFLCRQLKPKHLPAYLFPALHHLQQGPGPKGDIVKLCNRLSVSNKSLNQAFKKYLGLSPMKYSHLLMVNRALALLEQNPDQSFTQLAYELNFYDQAHFNHLFKTFTSLTPSQYVEHLKKEEVEKGSPNYIFSGG